MLVAAKDGAALLTNGKIVTQSCFFILIMAAPWWMIEENQLPREAATALLRCEHPRSYSTRRTVHENFGLLFQKSSYQDTVVQSLSDCYISSTLSDVERYQASFAVLFGVFIT